MPKPKHASDYNIQKFEIFSTRQKDAVNIAAHVSEVEIFENIELPYLTGTFNMKDDIAIYDGLGFNGSEIIKITFESPENVANHIEKLFHIFEITGAVKTTDNVEAIEIKIIEINGFNNSLMEINQTYTGTPDQIIKKILKDNLHMDMKAADMPAKGYGPYQQTMKITIPFVTPFEACQMVLNKMTTALGLPFYLYATLNTKNLQLKSLEEMLKTPLINPDSPYRYSQAYNNSSGSLKGEENIFNVSVYRSLNKENTMRMMRSGSTAGHHSITDITTGQIIDYTFNIENLISDLADVQIIETDQVPVHNSRYMFEGKNMNEYNTRNIHNCIASDTFTGINNIHQENNAADFRLAACSHAIKNMLEKSSMSIRVPGILFLLGANASLGRQINFVYPSNQTLIDGQDTSTTAETEDKKRSGRFIIQTARHHFNDQQHNVDMTCMKLGNPK